MLRLIPNILTLGRLVLSVVFLGIILYSPRASDGTRLLDTAFVIFVFAGLTDIVDGITARRLNVTSKFGRMIDPLADKVLVCGAFICFAIIGRPHLFGFSGAALSAIHWSVAGIITAREVYVTALRHIAEARGRDFAATASGKVKMFLQSIAIGTVIIKTAHVRTAAWGNWFTAAVFVLMLAVTVFSGATATRRSGWKA
jgi:CDP-diacylglycerol--glycerol-3-phosphate 3-phosphatidyltransferase